MTTPLPGDFFLAPIAGGVGLGIAFGQFLNGEGFRLYQHAGTYLGDGLTLEAMPGGAIIGDIDRYPAESLVWSTDIIGLSDIERRRIVSLARTYEGVPYSFLDYASIAALRFGYKPKVVRKYVASSGHMICSQMVDHLAMDAGVHYFEDGRFPGDVTPASLGMLLEERKAYNISQGI